MDFHDGVLLASHEKDVHYHVFASTTIRALQVPETRAI